MSPSAVLPLRSPRPPLRATLGCLVASAALTALATSDLRAQAPRGAPAATDPFCWRGRPLPRCRAFALFELGLYGGLATTRLRERYTLPVEQQSYLRDEPAFTSQLSWSVGAMRNRDSSTAVGGALVVAIADNGHVVAGTGRWRRWTTRGTSVELAAGPGAAQVPLPTFGGGIGWRPAAFAEARANAADFAAVSVRGVVAPRAGGRTHAGVHAGVAVGSGLAAAGTVGIVAATLLLIATIGQGAY